MLLKHGVILKLEFQQTGCESFLGRSMGVWGASLRKAEALSCSCVWSAMGAGLWAEMAMQPDWPAFWSKPLVCVLGALFPAEPLRWTCSLPQRLAVLWGDRLPLHLQGGWELGSIRVEGAEGARALAGGAQFAAGHQKLSPSSIFKR